MEFEAVCLFVKAAISTKTPGRKLEYLCLLQYCSLRPGTEPGEET